MKLLIAAPVLVALTGALAWEGSAEERCDGLEAQRVVIRYGDKETGLEMRLDSIVALRCAADCSDPSSLYYSVTLSSPAVTYERDLEELETVLQSWKATSAENAP